jgi:hypothetical protein
MLDAVCRLQNNSASSIVKAREGGASGCGDPANETQVLRLRSCSASRNSYSAQDDKFYKGAQNELVGGGRGGVYGAGAAAAFGDVGTFALEPAADFW